MSGQTTGQTTAHRQFGLAAAPLRRYDAMVGPDCPNRRRRYNDGGGPAPGCRPARPGSVRSDP